jgi:hypothetical protein
MKKINARKQHVQLLSPNAQGCLAGFRPRKFIFFQPFDPQAKPVSLPVKQLQPFPVAAAKQKYAASEYVLPHVFLHPGCKPINVLAHIGGPGLNVELRQLPVYEHDRPSKLESTACSRLASNPGRISNRYFLSTTNSKGDSCALGVCCGNLTSAVMTADVSGRLNLLIQ